MAARKFIHRLAVLVLGLFAAVASAQPAPGNWTWMGGSSTVPGANEGWPGVYGTLGTPAAGNVPGGRGDASTWTDRNGNFWLFGGYGYEPDGNLTELNDLWEFNPSTNEWAWMSGSSAGNQSGVYGTLGTPAAGNVPGGRNGASSWTDSHGNLWLFGGSGNELWMFSPSTNEWAWMGGSSTGNQSGVYGTLGTPAAGNIPGARVPAAAWTDRNGNFWLFGGTSAVAGNAFYSLNDLWEFNPSTNEWTWVSGSSTGSAGVYGTLGMAAAGNVPGSRSDAVAWTDSSGNLWLFGGYGYEPDGNLTELNDLWEFNPSTNEWAWMGGSSTGYYHAGLYGTLGTPAAGNVPGGREDVTGWTDSSGNFWLFGGYGLDSAGFNVYFNDLWEFNPFTNEWAWMSGSSAVNQSGVYGTLGTPAAGNIPGGRSFASGWTDSSGSLWLFGGPGYDSNGLQGLLNDLWKYQLSAATTPVLTTPTVTVTPSPASITTAQGTTVTVTVSGTPTPTGSVTLTSGTYSSGAVTLSSGFATINIPAGSLAKGTDTLTASYTPDAASSSTYTSATGSSTETVTAAATAPAVTVTPSPASITTAQALSVTVTVGGTPTPTGTVTLTSGTYSSGAVTLSAGSATINIPAGTLAKGTDTLTASYTPDAASSSIYTSATGSNTETVTAAATAPTVTVTPSPASITTAQGTTVTVTVSGTPTPTGSVTLTSGTYSSGAVTLSSGSATINIAAGALAKGTDMLTANYTPDAASSATYTSATGTNTVAVTSPALITPTVTVTPTPSSITTAQALSVTVTLSGGSGNSTPTGSVTLTSGTYTSGAVTLSAGSATINIPAGSLATSTDTLTATYTPDTSSSTTYNSATGSNTVTVTAATVQVTVGASPAGLSFSVDGTNYASTQTLTWTVGATHTVATTSPQNSTGTQYTFAAWSDGGALSHTVTASSTTTTYTATFSATAYQLTTAASPAADGTVSPASGTFYAPGTVVNLMATANTGFSFVNWTGSVAAANSASTTVTMSAPESVTANFGIVAAAAPVAVLTPTTLTFSGVSGTISAAQSATLTNSGNATLNITGITVTGTNAADFAIATGSNACGTTLAAGANCLIYITFTPASVATFSATLSVADNAAGSPQTATLSGTGTPAPTFTISTTTAPQTIQPGGSAQYTITATAQNGTFPSAVSLAASGLPTGAVATFSPASITPGSSTANSTLSIQTGTTTATAATRSSTWPFATSALAIIGLCLVPGRRRRRWITMALLLIASLGAFTALTACGGGFAFISPAQSYSITVTGTSGTDVQTTTVQLTVQ
jgi:N-acetylneuraminic acid mutarotase